MTSDEVLCKWAAKRFKLKDVTKVHIEEPYHKDGCPTCDFGATDTIFITVTYNKGKQKHFKHEGVVDLINDILKQTHGL